ncbi:DNA-binding domain-containing protein [Roseovarius sp. EL26]|uniref:HvfC/BufC N-terminal domain-containing protein n=1 Tax=Roseovarius sp. EL26 TaxID=2126672 RepID=UPI000EA0D238|nr:DNA-binding domain-containing protein [Roseovarius sp. EL26]
MSVSQDIFQAALLNPIATVPTGLIDAQARPAGQRFNVYRNNVAVSLTEAMHNAFPLISKLLGRTNMDGLAGTFLRQHPPSSPLMMHYGDALPDFLNNEKQLAHIPYLPDVARFELAIRRSYHAADSTPITPEELAIDPEQLASATIRFAPAMELVRSPWPVHAIWAYNTEPDAQKPQAAAQDTLITRPEFDPVPQLLPQGGADWILALCQGQTIGQAQDVALGIHPEFDLGTTLTLLLQGHAIISLVTEG